MPVTVTDISEREMFESLPEEFELRNTITITDHQINIYHASVDDLQTSVSDDVEQTYLLVDETHDDGVYIYRIFTEFDLRVSNTNHDEIQSMFVDDVDVTQTFTELSEDKLEETLLHTNSDDSEDVTITFTRQNLCEITLSQPLQNELSETLGSSLSKEDRIYLKQTLPQEIVVEYQFVNTTEL